MNLRQLLNLDGPPQAWMMLAGIALAVFGVTAVIYLLVLDPHSWLRVAWTRYEAALEREVRFLLKKTTGKKIARTQLAVGIAVFVGAFAVGSFFILLFLFPIVAFGPIWKLTSEHEKRVSMLESQLDQWLLMLSNALKATPSLGEAMSSSARLMRAPISEELDLCLKEVALGTPLDQAIMTMSTRVRSRIFSGSLTAILVGRQTGGDMSRILEESSATLREMSRLEGVVRTKTAEGKSQAYVLGAMPFFLTGALHMLDNNWLKPLVQTTLGFMLIGIAFVLWALAIILARRILAVDV